jgi:Icc-related predicted phosphoesterase
MRDLPHKEKFFIFGNHSLGTEYGYKREPAINMVKDAGVHYLQDSGVEIDGLHIWGSPINKWFHNWEYNRFPGADIQKHWNLIPTNTNILITHGPCYGILDQVEPGQSDHLGDENLLETVLKLKELKLSVCGHIHGSHGWTKQGEVIYVNAAICDESYNPTNKPIVIDLP